MSQDDVERFRRGFEHFAATGEFLAENVHPDFVWDMSTFRGWPEQPTYLGIEGARQFHSEWAGAWDDWEIEAEDDIDAGERIVVVLRQRGRSRPPAFRSTCASARCGRFRTARESGCRCTRARRKPAKPPGCRSRPS